MSLICDTLSVLTVLFAFNEAPLDNMMTCCEDVNGNLY